MIGGEEVRTTSLEIRSSEADEGWTGSDAGVDCTVGVGVALLAIDVLDKPARTHVTVEVDHGTPALSM